MNIREYKNEYLKDENNRQELTQNLKYLMGLKQELKYIKVGGLSILNLSD